MKIKATHLLITGMIILLVFITLLGKRFSMVSELSKEMQVRELTPEELCTMQGGNPIKYQECPGGFKWILCKMGLVSKVTKTECDMTPKYVMWGFIGLGFLIMIISIALILTRGNEPIYVLER